MSTTDRYDYWLFDLDGTLVTVEEKYIQRTLDRVGRALGVEFTPEEARRIWHGRDDFRDESIRAHGLSPGDFWSAFHEIESRVERADATRLHPDATAVRTLDGPKAIVTHCQPHLTAPILDTLDIDTWFDTVVCCSDRIGWKPNPHPLELAMDRLEVPGGRGVMVGDSTADVGAARNAGVDGILIDRDGTGATEADIVIDSLGRLAR